MFTRQHKNSLFLTIFSVISIILLLTCASQSVIAQSTPTTLFVKGTVTTTEGTPIEGATVTIKPVVTGDTSTYGLSAFKTYTVQTSADGTYQKDIEAYFDLYKITVSKNEYRPASSTIKTGAAALVQKDFTLELLTYTQEDIWVYAQFGKFDVNEETGKIQGEYVSFTLRNGSILSYAVKDRVLFDVSYSTSNLFTTPPTAIKSHLKIAGPDYEITVYDSPTGYININTTNTISFSFDTSYNLSLHQAAVNVSSPGFSAAVIHGAQHAAEFNIDHDTGLVTTTGQAKFFLRNLTDERQRWLIDNAIQDGRIGAEIVVHLGENGTYQHDVMTYSDIDVNATADEGEVLLLVSGDEETLGKTIVVNTDNKTFYMFSELNVTYDGEPISLADDISDVLNPNNDGVNPEWYIGRGANGTQILISVPHFSEYAIKIFSMEIEPEILIQYTLLALFIGIFIVLFAALGMFRRTY